MTKHEAIATLETMRAQILVVTETVQNEARLDNAKTVEKAKRLFEEHTAVHGADPRAQAAYDTLVIETTVALTKMIEVTNTERDLAIARIDAQIAEVSKW
jgi:hypothetical protein